MIKMDLWQFIERDADAEWLQEIKNGGGKVELDDEFEIKAFANIGDRVDDTLQYIMDNKSTCHAYSFSEDLWDDDEYTQQVRLPGTVGFNKENTFEYSWIGDSLKELYGRELFETAQVEYEDAECKLLVYMPGNVCCLHLDMYQAWADTNQNLNPNITHHTELSRMVSEDRKNRWDIANKNTCDKGQIVRRNVMISEWHWGHVIQLENTFLPRWNAGDVFTIPPCIYHLSANVGVTLKMTLILTGVELDD